MNKSTYPGMWRCDKHKTTQNLKRDCRECANEKRSKHITDINKSNNSKGEQWEQRRK